MIVIVDYGVGNSGSILNMLRRIGVDDCATSSDPGVIRQADRLILPGVGAFDKAMSRLQEHQLIPVLNEVVLDAKVPILGICLGMQLLTEGSEEGVLPGLGWIKAKARAFDLAESGLRLPVPNMGWRDVEWRADHRLSKGMPSEPRYYFAHSYHVVCDSDEFVLGRSWYGVPYTASIGCENVLGVQFHPEKSHRFGMHLLRRFAEMDS